jgi:eukaryotic-like serine/threonine-protein kinase
VSAAAQANPLFSRNATVSVDGLDGALTPLCGAEPQRAATAPTGTDPSHSWPPRARRPSWQQRLGTDLTEAGPRARQALHGYEAARARGLAVVLALLCLITLCAVPILGGHPVLRVVMIVTCAYLMVTSIVVMIRVRPDAEYRFLFRWFGVSCVAAAAVVVYYFGVFSPAAVAVAFGISFFGTAEDRAFGVGCCIAGIVTYACLGFAIVLGILPDAGLIQNVSGVTGQVFAMLMVPLALVGVLRQARLSRRAARDAVAEVEHAVRVLEQREALLAEANMDLEQALDAGGGPGRHSGRQAGKWILGPVIGRGAMGEVYAAVDAKTNERVAVKTLLDAEPHRVERFLREARITMQLRAPGLVRVLQSGTFEDGSPYLVMELLRGHDLAWILRKSRRLDIERVVELCDQIATGLDAAHEAGIVHRDIKPQNLFFHQPDRAWKILDFGVSKLAGSRGTLTHDGVVGTPAYMSPEQARSESIDARSDVFSLGSVLYRALTGQPPFAGKDSPKIMFDVVFKAPAQPSQVAPHLSAQIDAVLAIAMAKRSEDRFDSAGELADALRDAVAGSLDETYVDRARILVSELPWRGGRMNDSEREAKTMRVSQPKLTSHNR